VGVPIASIDWDDVGEGAAADSSPISDLRGSASMRRELLKIYAPRVIKLAIARAQQQSRNGA
jgi:CO/xanthine dehydrogenase FAD-binding subunit